VCIFYIYLKKKNGYHNFSNWETKRCMLNKINQALRVLLSDLTRDGTSFGHRQLCPDSWTIYIYIYFFTCFNMRILIKFLINSFMIPEILSAKPMNTESLARACKGSLVIRNISFQTWRKGRWTLLKESKILEM
jgi:hypothetical protein